MSTIELPEGAVLAIQRLRYLSNDWQIGSGGAMNDSFSDEIERFGARLATDGTYESATSRNDVRRIFDTIADLLDELQAMDNADVENPDYDGPDEVESRAPRDPALEAAEDKDR